MCGTFGGHCPKGVWSEVMGLWGLWDMSIMTTVGWPCDSGLFKKARVVFIYKKN